jgi:hypothetical protein
MAAPLLMSNPEEKDGKLELSMATAELDFATTSATALSTGTAQT